MNTAPELPTFESVTTPFNHPKILTPLILVIPPLKSPPVVHPRHPHRTNWIIASVLLIVSVFALYVIQARQAIRRNGLIYSQMSSYYRWAGYYKVFPLA